MVYYSLVVVYIWIKFGALQANVGGVWVAYYCLVVVYIWIKAGALQAKVGGFVWFITV